MDLIKSTEKKLKEWEGRENIPFHSRPSFTPMWTQEDILGWKNELELLEWTYEEPKPINIKYDYDE
jgi:hypothetical protein